MRRVVMAVAVLAGLMLAAAGIAATSSAKADELEIWVGWSARELSEFKKVVAEYDTKNPNVTVKVVGAINDDKILAALRSGNAPDVVSSFTSQNVGVYCPSGGWIDLAPYLKRDKIDVQHLPGCDADVHAVQGRPLRVCRCSPTRTASTTTSGSSRRPG